MKKIMPLFMMFLLASCATSIKTQLANKSYSKLAEDIAVVVLDKEDLLPTNSELIGEIKVGDTGFTKECGYSKVINDAKTEAINAGANIVQITEVKPPSTFGSTCYRIIGKMYRNLNADALASLNENLALQNKSRLPADSDYALIHFYRPNSGTGYLLGYKIKNEKDSIIGRLRNGEKFVYKTKKFGTQIFSGALETTEEIKLNIEKGKEYFVRCGVGLGVLIGRPTIIDVESRSAIKEIELMD